MKYIVYADGACSVSHCLGGYSAIVQYDLGRVMLHGAKKNATNNEMELLAVISALRNISYSYKLGDEIVVYTDSAYIVNTINNNWYEYWMNNGWTTKSSGKSIRNKKLWKELVKYVLTYDICFKWVKGHAGNIMNELCDKMAKDEVKYLKQEETENAECC